MEDMRHDERVPASMRGCVQVCSHEASQTPPGLGSAKSHFARKVNKFKLEGTRLGLPYFREESEMLTVYNFHLPAFATTKDTW